MPVPAQGFSISADGRSASVEIRNLAVVNQPKYPDINPTTPATMSFRMVWTAMGEPFMSGDPAKHFTARVASAQVQGEFEVAAPSLNFTWKSDPLETSAAQFGIIGAEVNGLFYDPQVPKLVGLSEGEARAKLRSLGVTKIVVDYQDAAKLGSVVDQYPVGAVVSHVPAAGRPFDPTATFTLGVRSS